MADAPEQVTVLSDSVDSLLTIVHELARPLTGEERAVVDESLATISTSLSNVALPDLARKAAGSTAD